MKRNATSDLNHTNWDEEDEKEERGDFVTADKSVISQRKVIQARRKPTSTTTNNVFKSFIGFGSTVNPSINNTFNITSDDVEKNKEKHINSLKLLNQQFLECIQKHINENPVCVLTPTLDDYDKNLNIIKEKYPLVATSDSSISFSNVPKTDSNEVSSSSSTAPVFGIKEKVTTSFNFGLKNAEVSKSSIFSLNSEKSSNPISNFVLPVDSAETTTIPLSFSSGSNLFGNGAFSSSEVSKGNEEDEEYVPPIAEVREVKEADSVYEVRSKLYYKLENEWKERGVGNLFIKPIANGKFQLVIRADNSLATIILNVLINDKTPLSVNKNNVSLVVMTDFCKEIKPTPLLIRVKNPESAEALLKEMKKLL